MKATLNQRFLTHRDPQGVLLDIEHRLVRLVRVEETPAEKSKVVRELIAAGSFIDAKRLSADDFSRFRTVSRGLGDFLLALEHPRLPFVAYPYEWPAEMLHAAGMLTLQIAKRLLGEGMGLKDASPYNVVFNGTKPVFVDWLSVEKREAGDPIWAAMGQFCRTFLHPLLLSRAVGISTAQLLLLHGDGLNLQQAHHLCPPLTRFSPRYFGTITLPYWMERRWGRQISDRKSTPVAADRASLSLEWTLGGMQRRLRALTPAATRRSAWTGYDGGRQSYSDEQTTYKEGVVEEFLNKARPKRVLDVGCNRGRYSEKAARSGAAVVAIDSDEAVVGAVWRRAKQENLDILPLVVDIGRPTPALGWRNEEGLSFLERSRGSFDLVMMLAVIHHLRWSSNIGLDAIVDLAAGLTSRFALIEFVGDQDPLYRMLANGRRDERWSRAGFESTCARHFKIHERREIPQSDRVLYLLEIN